MPTDEERASFKRAELHRTHRCATCEAEAVTAALDALAAEVEWFLRDIADQVPDEWIEPESSMAMQVTIRTRDLAAVLAAIEKARP